MMGASSFFLCDSRELQGVGPYILALYSFFLGFFFFISLDFSSLMR